MAVDQIDGLRKFSVVSLQVANPAAGADWSVAVPAGQIWRVRAILAKLTTSATVANRVPALVISDAGANLLHKQYVLGTVTAGSIVVGNWGAGLPIQNASGFFLSAIPAELTLPEGSTIATSTAAIQVGDQWSTISLLIEEANAL